MEYDSTTGHLLVEHAYPANARRVPRASVDANLVLESTKRELFSKGPWINVIGYVQHNSEALRSERPGVRGQRTITGVRAVLIWDAGAVRIEEYERAMKQSRDAKKSP